MMASAPVHRLASLAAPLLVLLVGACARPTDAVSPVHGEISDAKPVAPSGGGIALGYGHACAWASDGKAWCWGENERGQLGDGTTKPRTQPVRVAIDDIGAMSVGFGFTCARKGDGTVWCWGDGTLGKLGDGTKTSRVTPAMVPGVEGAVELVSGSVHSCARLVSGAVLCWGDGGSNQLGAESPHGVAVRVPGVMHAVEIAASNGHSCARSADGSVRCWGRNDVGQLGFGTVGERAACGQPGAPIIEVVVPGSSLAPVVVSALAGGTQLTASADRTCVRRFDGTVRCTHDPRDGYGAFVPEKKLTKVVQLAAGVRHGCALLDDGSVRCFGSNEHGESGAASLSWVHEPSPVAGLGGVIEVRCGHELTCARKGDGSVWCWGKNLQGELGDGSKKDRSTPVQVTAGVIAL